MGSQLGGGDDFLEIEDLNQMGVDQNAGERLMGIIDRGIGLPELPIGGAELLSMIRRPIEQIDSRHVIQLIEGQPSLSAQLLKIANSVHYGFKRRIHTLRHAVNLVGLEETLATINYFVFARLMRLETRSQRFDCDAFLAHSLACATAARHLGGPQYLLQTLPGELYLIGLFHDVGKVLMATHAPNEYDYCLHIAAEAQIPVYRVERQVLGLDHALLGAHLLDGWDMPRSILDAVAMHHDPAAAQAESRNATAAIEFSDVVANSIGFGDNPHLVPTDTWFCQVGQGPGSSPIGRQKALERLTLVIREQDERLRTALESRSDAPEPSREAGESVPDPAPAASEHQRPEGQPLAIKSATNHPVRHWLSTLWRRVAEPSRQ